MSNRETMSNRLIHLHQTVERLLLDGQMVRMTAKLIIDLFQLPNHLTQLVYFFLSLFFLLYGLWSMGGGVANQFICLSLMDYGHRKGQHILSITLNKRHGNVSCLYNFIMLFGKVTHIDQAYRSQDQVCSHAPTWK